MWLEVVMVMSGVMLALLLGAQDGVGVQPAPLDSTPQAPPAAEPAPMPPAASTEPAPPAAAPAADLSAAASAETAPAPSASPAAEAPPAVEPAAAPAAPPREKTFKDPKARKEKPRHVRPWWSWGGIGAGLATAALAAAVTAGGVGVQVLALYFWYDQTNADRKRAEREFATNRARATQWVAVVMLVGGIGVFFGGLIGATYAFGFGNPMPKSAKDL